MSEQLKAARNAALRAVHEENDELLVRSLDRLTPTELAELARDARVLGDVATAKLQRRREQEVRVGAEERYA